MKNRIIFFCLLVLTNSFWAMAQVNLQTGAAQYSIPLFSYSDGANRLSSGIGLAYTAGNGIKAADVASTVGTGWGIDFGGVITRIQHGEPDDQKQDGSFPYPYPNSTDPSAYLNYANNYYPDGYLYSTYNAATPVDNGGGYIPLFPSSYFGPYKQLPTYVTDREQDQFMFSFNGQQGYFVIGKNGEIKTLEDSKLKIEMVTTNMTANNIITRISEFHITDAGGTEYVFKDLELSQLIQYKRQGGLSLGNLVILYPMASGPQTHNIFRGEAKNLFTVGKWLLSEIKNPLTGKKITFNYGTYDIDMLGNKSGYRSVINSKVDITIQLERIKGKAKRITSIQYSDKDQVVFNYSSNNRNDLSFDKALESIDIKYDNIIKYSWKFSFGYFVKNQIKAYDAVLTQAEKYKSRLCLLSVQKKTADQSLSIPPHTFSYYIGSYSYVFNGTTYTDDLQLAPAFTFYQDHWGYPNRWFTLADYMDDLREDINYDNVDWGLVENYVINGLSIRDVYGFGYMAGMLKTIKNSTGGEQTFEYENNKATVTGGTQQIVMGGARVNKVTMYDGISHANDIVQEYKYIREDGLSSGWGYEAPVYQTSKSQRVYNCGDGLKPGQILATVASSLPSMFSASTTAALSAFGQKNLLGGGVQVNPQVLMNMAVTIIIYIIFDIMTPAYEDYATNEWSYYSTVAGNTLPYQYKRVELVNKLGAGTTGKTTFQFTSDQDFTIDVASLAVPNSARPRYAYWAYGLPLSSLVEDKNGNDISKTEYTYDLIKNTLNNSNYVSQKWRSNKQTYNCDYTPGSGLPSADINHDVYYPIYGRIEMKQKKEYVYNDLQQSALTTTNYEYSATHFQLRKSSALNSKGELVESYVYYADDYTLSGVPQTMRNTRNMGSIPLSSQTIITKAGLKYLLAGTVTEFGLAPNGDIKPIKTYATRIADPVLASTAPFSAAQLIPGTGLYENISETNYSGDGLPVQIVSDQGKASTIYDYDKQLPVATILNASITDVAYTSFEADGNGGWTFDPLKITEEFSPTGKKNLKAVPGGSGAVISRTISNAKRYVLSFWKKGDNPVLSGASYFLRRSYLNQATGFTYYEYEVSGGTTVSITNRTGASLPYTYHTFNLDEIRLYPIEARMSTITYDPVWGKTAEADQNGRISYYEYDLLGRLKVVRDQDRNVIRAYEYNYKQ